MGNLSLKVISLPFRKSAQGFGKGGSEADSRQMIHGSGESKPKQGCPPPYDGLT